MFSPKLIGALNATNLLILMEDISVFCTLSACGSFSVLLSLFVVFSRLRWETMPALAVSGLSHTDRMCSYCIYLALVEITRQSQIPSLRRLTFSTFSLTRAKPFFAKRRLQQLYLLKLIHTPVFNFIISFKRSVFR